ncbi:alpha/beta hydrolase [uncultured Limnohabitans sp.]|jgi:pimeloyl-ACP methyl ester carboxylesterase|uniref:alpha/beta fold hydrolase n=1 Tax=uncultured Limnohabitans sp. TaxID=768543 RepID=UPI00260384FC|nr:alpha/beta hydrolase [uncultured Limnohabitans sp.]
MANFLLVHGAWHGAWCWQRVLPRLMGAGHRAHAVTLTGVGERAHLLHPGIDLETHITDVTAAMDAEEMDEVVLVVHSYAGMLGTAVADRRAERLCHLVYLDAVLPKPGESWSSTHASATRQARIDAAQAHPLHAFPAPDPAVFGLSDADHAWVQRRQTPHPGGPYSHALDFDPQRVASVPRSFINCTTPALGTIDVSRQRMRDPKFWDGAWLPGSQVIDMPTGHDPMVSDPEGLVQHLLSLL